MRCASARAHGSLCEFDLSRGHLYPSGIVVAVIAGVFLSTIEPIQQFLIHFPWACAPARWNIVWRNETIEFKKVF